MGSVVAARTPGQRIVKGAAGRGARDDTLGCRRRDGAGGELVLHEVAVGGDAGAGWRGCAKLGRVRAGACPCGAATPPIWHREPGRRGLQIAREGGWRYRRREGGFAFEICAEWVFRGSRLIMRDGRWLDARGSGRGGGNRGVCASSTTVAIGRNVPGGAVGGVGL